MANIVLKEFFGEMHRRGSRILPPGRAYAASNVKPFSRELRPWFKALSVVTASKAALGPILSFYRVNTGAYGIGGIDYWLNWLTDVDVAKSPIPGDTTQRFYWTGDSEPRESNVALATSGADYPTQWYVMGVIAPTPTPSVTPSGGAATNVTRVYQYTMVTTWGEEGAPSPASTPTTGHPDGTWTIANLETTVPNSGTISAAVAGAGFVTVTFDTTAYLRAGEQITIAAVTGMTSLNGTWAIASVVDSTHITVALSTAQTYISGGTWTRLAPHNTTGMFKRLYRQDLNGTYRLVADNIALATASVVDGVSDSQLALNSALVSTFFAMPPTNLKGLLLGWNGMIFGISGNMLCVCEPYQPHAWPTSYQYPLAYPPVGLAIAGSQMLVVATQGNPSIAIGTFSDSLTVTPVPLFEPCVSKRGMASFEFGALYPSNNGLILIGASGAVIATAIVALHDEWQQYNPSALHAANWQQRYLGFLSAASPLSSPDGNPIGGVYFDNSEAAYDLFDFDDSFVCSEAWTDPQTGLLYVCDNSGVIRQFDSDTLNYVSFDWTSGVYQFQKPINMAIAKVDAAYELLQDTVTQQAQQAADEAANNALMAGSETWPGQGVTQGCVNEFQVNAMQVNGSLLVGGYYNFVPRYLNFLFYASDESNVLSVKYSKSITSDRPFRLPKGYASAEAQIRMAGNINVYRIKVAESVEELDKI